MTHRLFGRADCVLAITPILYYACFHQAVGWNQPSRRRLS
jgi:hypothetical protein